MKLILINGPAGVGKTTVAKLLHNEIPFSYLLDLDEQRNFINSWQSRREDARILSCNIALAIAEECLRKGVDFIIGKTMLDKILPGNDKNVLDLFIGLGNKYQAEVYEIMLWAEKRTVFKRADNRGYRIKTHLSSKKVAEEWELMKAFKNKRSNSIIIDTTHKSTNKVLLELKDKINL